MSRSGQKAANSHAQAVAGCVCDAVGCVFAVRRPDLLRPLDASMLYESKKASPMIVSTCRHFVYYVLKDKFGYSYRRISHIAGVSVGEVMKQVRKLREGVFYDALFGEILREIERRMADGIF